MKKDIAPQRRSRKNTVVAAMLAAVIVMAFVCLFVGSSNMSLGDAFAALAKKGSSANNRIIWNIRIPRVLAAVIAGAVLIVGVFLFIQFREAVEDKGFWQNFNSAAVAAL